MQREFTSDEVKECVAKHKNRNAAGADEIVNEFLKYGGEGMITMMAQYGEMGCGKSCGKRGSEGKCGEW